MNAREIRLAIDLAGTHNDILSPSYESIRDELNGSLASGSLQLSDLRADTKQREINARTIRMFANLLPRNIRYETYGPRFETPYDARRFQSTAMWIKSLKDNNIWTTVPHVTVGARYSSKSPKVTEMLLLPLTLAFKSNPTVSKIRTKDYDAILTHQRRVGSSEFSADELNSVYQPSPETACDIKISPDSASSVSLDEHSYISTLFGANLFRNVFHPIRSRGVPFQGVQTVRVTSDYNEPQGLNDYEMGAFNVFERLGELATKFEITDTYQDMIAGIEVV